MNFREKIQFSHIAWIGNKIADRITKFLGSSLQNNSETVESETENRGFDSKIHRERYIYLQKENRKLLTI